MNGKSSDGRKFFNRKSVYMDETSSDGRAHHGLQDLLLDVGQEMVIKFVPGIYRWT